MNRAILLRSKLCIATKKCLQQNILRVAMSGSSSGSGVNENQPKDPGFLMKATLKTIGLKFPSVQNISTSQLNSWLETPEKKTVAVLDCREEAEYFISHIIGAIHAGYDKPKTFEELMELIEAQMNGKPNPTIVCYCSVGYRASDTAQKLTNFYEKSAKQPKPEIFNLHGSLFQWAEEKRSMVDKNGEVTPYIHPYSAVFGKLVAKELRKESL